MNRQFGGFLLFMVTVLGADVTGKWSGSFDVTGPDGETKQSTAYMSLKQSGTEITGTAGPDENQQWPILNGKIDEDKITFEVQTDKPLIKFDLRLVEGHLKGEAKGEKDGKTVKASVDLTRKAD